MIGTHGALMSYFADHRDRVYRPATARLGRKLRIAHAWSLSFDASWQPMIGLLDGHVVHLFDAEAMRDAGLLVRGMVERGVDMIDTTPSMLAQLSAAGLLDHELAVLALGGEAIETALWDRLRSLSDTAVYNCYGPTETTVEAVVAAVKDYPAPTIGTPNQGMVGYVLDSRLRPVPDGAVGELYLAGSQLARGYAGKPAVTSAAFVADPRRAGQRMYRTGDLVRRLPHGGFAYLGRADSQVKIRGYRVEVGEIESALRLQPDVQTAAVTVVRRAGGASLVGFVVCEKDTFDSARAMMRLADRLPSYMMPSRLVPLPQLPVTVNGKLDGSALERLAHEALSGGAAGEQVQPATATECVLCECCAELFDGTAPGIDEDFFSLGVDSIVAISLVNKARKRDLVITRAWCWQHRPSVSSRLLLTLVVTWIPWREKLITVRCHRCRWFRGCMRARSIVGSRCRSWFGCLRGLTVRGSNRCFSCFSTDSPCCGRPWSTRPTAPEWSPANREWCAAKVCSAESSCPRANPLMPPSPMPRGKPLIPWTRARAR